MNVDGKLHINFHFLRHLILSGYLTDPQEQNNLLMLDKFIFVLPHLIIKKAVDKKNSIDYRHKA